MADNTSTATRTTFICKQCGCEAEQRTGKGRPWSVCRPCAQTLGHNKYKVAKTVVCRHCAHTFDAYARPAVTKMVCPSCKASPMRAYKDALAARIKQARKRRTETAASIYLEAKCSQCRRVIWLDGNAVSNGQRTCGMARCQNHSRYATPTYQDSYAHNNHRRRTNYRAGERIAKSLVWERDMGMCHICNQAADHNDWHLDHIVPISRGGTHTWDNVAVSHPACNLSKGAKLAA